MMKRYKSEESLLTAIDRLHVLHDKDCVEVEQLHREIEAAKLSAAARGELVADGVNFKRTRIWAIERRMKGRRKRLDVLKGLLAEFQTLILPLHIDVMGEGSVKRR
jgi:hypothetical protein